jgi:hypothetical protein
MILVSCIQKIAESAYWEETLRDKFGINSFSKEPEIPLDPIILRQVYQILNLIPDRMVKSCGINKLYISNKMGNNRSYFPNHGYFVGDSVTLNADIFYSPDKPEDFFDHHGYFIDRPTQTLLHEFAHGYDEHNGNLSLRKKWLKLSGWDPEPKKGLKRLIVQSKDAPDVIGEWYYNPKASFTRFYAKRNPWDDWADSCSFYLGKLRSKVPDDKRDYFEALLKRYYK